jgi:hypothetical protein
MRLNTYTGNTIIVIYTISGIKAILQDSSEKFVTQSTTGLQIYEGHDDQLNKPVLDCVTNLIFFYRIRV